MTVIQLPEASVFIDGDWLHYTVKRLGKEIDYARLWEVLHEHFGADTPVYFFCSFDPQKQEQIKFLQLLGQLGYIVKVSVLKRKKDRVTIKGLDVALAVQAALPAYVRVFGRIERMMNNEEIFKIVDFSQFDQAAGVDKLLDALNGLSSIIGQKDIEESDLQAQYPDVFISPVGIYR